VRTMRRLLGILVGAALFVWLAAAAATGSTDASATTASGHFVFTQYTDQGPGLDSAEAIYSIRTDGSGIRRLAGSSSCTDCADSPRWSPDGSRIAYDGEGPNYDSGLIVMKADGSRKRLICRDCFGWSTWSPDGRRIASARSGPGIDILTTSGRLIRRILGRRQHPPIFALDWSADGRQFAFDDDVPGQRVFVVNSNGTGLRMVASGGDPRWSPDGKTLLVVRRDRRGLNLLPAGGGPSMPIRSFPHKQVVTGSVAWSADGHEIAYFGVHGIHVLDLTTGKDREISLPTGICTHGHWCADLDWQRT
jgi:dipeptidyl aminopeptidase/acylaminoacyl peptidase